MGEIRLYIWGVLNLLLLIGVSTKASNIVYHSVDNGLSQNEVTSIIQDQTGFMWFGTRGGLNRYDGYVYQHFKPDPAIPTSLNGTSIERLFQDSKGLIWIGTKTSGLSVYDPKTEQFTSLYSSDEKDSTKIFGNRILTFAEDHEGNIWIGTWGHGVFRYNYSTKTFTHLLGWIKILDIIQTRDQRIWVSTWSGLMSTDLKTLQFRQEGEGQIGSEICALVEDPHKPIIWFGGWGTGLGEYNYSNHSLQYHHPNPNHKCNVYQLKFDSQGQFWVGYWGDGLYQFNRNNQKFTEIQLIDDHFYQNDFNYKIILDVEEDRNHVIWVGIDGGGICQISPTPKFYGIGVKQLGDKYINSHIISIIQDQHQNLLMGSRGNGVYLSKNLEDMVNLPFPNENSDETVYTFLNSADGTTWIGADGGLYWVRYRGTTPVIEAAQLTGSSSSVYINKVLSVIEHGDELWAGTQQRGLYIFKREGEGKLQLKQHIQGNSREPGELQSDRVGCMLNDSQGRIWLGTYGGLFLYSGKDDTFQKVEDLTDDHLTSKIILSIHEDHAKNIWVGTPNGLNKITSKSGSRFSIQYFNNSTGFADDYIHSVEEDSDNNLWISTNMGLIKYNPTTGAFNHFDDSDGIQGKSFSEMASFKDQKGRLFFAGKNGVTYFYPNEIKPNENPPRLVFTQFNIFNKPVQIGSKINGRVILNSSINDLKSITLSYHEREFSFEFAALDYINPQRNQYAYMLEGYDKDWVHVGSRRLISFNNLKPGKYILRIKGSNNNNIWCEVDRVLNIRVLPPFWKTWYALVSYIFFTLMIVEGIRWSSVRQAKLSSNLEIQKQKQEQERKINEMKISFFTNISHEIRTPLTLISGPLNVLLSNEKYRNDSELHSKLSVLQQNTKRLLNLVNQLLDFRKAETGNLKLSVQETNLTELVTEVTMPFRELANINQLHFEVKTSKPELKFWCDRNKVEMILNNLVSNAFNSCHKDCTISVELDETDESMVMSIIDNGCGIQESELELIFKTFYQATQNRKSSNTGTGIGLALVKQLVDLHQATIRVESIPNEQTKFTVTFKKGQSHFSKDDLSMVATSMEKVQPHFIAFNEPKLKLEEAPSSSLKLLIVEDNREMQQFLADLFHGVYQVQTANNGEEGLKAAANFKPNIIISDVMMPVVDGLEMCRELKSNEETAHIPVVILTAKSSEQLRLFSSQLGADEYVSKPFDPEYLKSRVYNLLNAQQLMRSKYSRKVTLAPTDIEISDYEEKLINQAKEFVEQNLENINFNAEMLAAELGMSHSTLYRKLKLLTGYSIVGFINKIRVQRAAQLMLNKEMTITEIMYKVGFNDLKHFRKCFQKEFDLGPSDYRKTLN